MGTLFTIQLFLIMAGFSYGQEGCPPIDELSGAAVDIQQLPHCRYWNNDIYLDQELRLMKDLDQLIPGAGGPKGYDLNVLTKKVPEQCREHPEAHANAEKAALNELKCGKFLKSLEFYGDCYKANGIVKKEAPEGWDGKEWDGADAWNLSFSKLSNAARCTRMKQALAHATSVLATAKPAFGVDPLTHGDHALFVRSPKPEHYRDREKAGWALRYLRFTKWDLVPDDCKWVKQEGGYRWVEAWNQWEETYPQVFKLYGQPKTFGRQSLGYAYGMCGRCNNAHWTDRVSQILRFNKDEKDPKNRIYVPPQNRRFVESLSYKDGVTNLEVRGPWNGDIDWMKFLGAQNKPEPKKKSILDEIGIPPGFDPLKFDSQF